MNDGLYHREIGFPSRVKLLFFGVGYRLDYSRHAKLACVRDRYGVISKPPFTATVTANNLVEVEIEHGNIVKLVIRVQYDENFDISLALAPDFHMATVKTCWLNRRDDIHETLKRELYKTP